MALLSVSERKRLFNALGYEYNEEGIKKLQKKYLRKKDVDGIYGPNTDNLLRHVYNCSLVKNFEPEEFKCECGGRYCTGYPSYMKQVELNNLQAIRDHYGKPMVVTCGLRCRTYNNKIAGSIANSKHLSGYATDFYMKGVTDTLANRKAAIKWIKKLPNHNYTYGNGINSNGYAVRAPYMGNALHTDTNKPKAATKPAAPKAQTPQDKICVVAKDIADSGKYKYIKYDKAYAKKCGFCAPIKGKGSGGNCIDFAFHCWHVVTGCKCSFQVMTDQLYEKLLKVSAKEALKIVKERTGLKDIKVITDKGGISTSKLKKGDIIAYFNGNDYIHTAIYIGDGKIADCTSGRKQSVKYGVKSYSKWKIKEAIRYTGK